jgi:anti-sigma factor RsiW
MNLSVQHLSDEAVAAFADGMLGSAAHSRASRHIAQCPECAAAIDDQRAAVSALRAAPRPTLPAGLLERLRAVPATTPLTPARLSLAPDGSAVFPAFGTTEGEAPAEPDQHSFGWPEFHFPVALSFPGSHALGRRTQQLAVVAAALAILSLGAVGSAAAGTSAQGSDLRGGTGTAGPVEQVRYLGSGGRRFDSAYQLVGSVSTVSRP